mmetsp:Transcript_1447/g.1982  ORF Transcript_1447/g.1982 Transcript_1447/m.1982 type:complete len:95 (+) Transcript_1447:876-1160(+)
MGLEDCKQIEIVSLADQRTTHTDGGRFAWFTTLQYRLRHNKQKLQDCLFFQLLNLRENYGSIKYSRLAKIEKSSKVLWEKCENFFLRERDISTT